MLLAQIAKYSELDRISLKNRGVTSRAQIIRAVIVGILFALIFVWALPGGVNGV